MNSKDTTRPFNDQDRAQLRAHGIDELSALTQLNFFRAGKHFIRLDRPATLHDGIVAFAPHELTHLDQSYAKTAALGSTLGFVPASGAATRMFKGLTTVLNRTDRPTLARLAADANQDEDIREFLIWFRRLKEFPFYSQLQNALSLQDQNLESLLKTEDYRPILECLLTKGGMGYADLPKALIPFHNYPNGTRTALEEQLAEATGLFRDERGICRLHFTVSPEHQKPILALLENARKHMEKDGLRFEFGLSQQGHSTDTLAVDQENTPMRNLDSTLILRPGGHGALLENLQGTGKDIVFIKNIDNLAPARLRPQVLAHRRALGGYLVQLQDRLFAYLRRLETEKDPNLTEEISRFAEINFGLRPPDSLETRPSNSNYLPSKIAFLQKNLNRPIRVCAMVKNQGEPGGGPFWVRHLDGTCSLQIVEAAQVDLSDPIQRKISESATHFNPVDLVCGIRNYRGEAFLLQDYADPETHIVSTKSKNGKAFKTLELPGLWNGSMAYWNTVFVETPITTFNPVKSVNDLLRENHQP